MIGPDTTTGVDIRLGRVEYDKKEIKKKKKTFMK